MAGKKRKGGWVRRKNGKIVKLTSQGKLVTVVTGSPAPMRDDVQTVFFYAEVTSARLRLLTEMFERGTITARVGSVLPLEQTRRTHEMLAGAPHAPGKLFDCSGKNSPEQSTR